MTHAHDVLATLNAASLQDCREKLNEAHAIVKQQAAVIEQMREALSYYKDAVCGGDSPGGGYYSLEPDGFVAIKALTLQPCPEVLNKVRADAVRELYNWYMDQDVFDHLGEAAIETFIAQRIEKGEV